MRYLMLLAASVALVMPALPTSAMAPPTPRPIPQNGFPDVVFLQTDGTTPPSTILDALRAIDEDGLADLLTASSVTRGAAGVADAALDRMLARERATTGRMPRDPRFDAYVTLPAGADADMLITRLSASPAVVMAAIAPKPVESPMIAAPGGTPNYQGQQYYENAASQGGIGAEVAWSNGITGAGVAMCDIEYDFNESHCDLPPIIELGFDPVSPYGDGHGTAVLGEMIALDDGTGVKGIAYGATELYFAGSYDGNVNDFGAAMYRAIAALPAGSVMLLEAQIQGPNWNDDGFGTGFVPAEWWRPWYDATRTAVANDIIVLAAAGNGYQNLDDPIYSTGNFGHHPFLPQNDSGAIMVGAGAGWPTCYSYPARTRLPFSNYGSRLDTQGYGGCVYTTGYGDLLDTANCDFTSTFGGTSSATPIVAGACMLVQERARELLGRSLNCVEMRDLLESTGTPQTGDLSFHIGPLPNVIAAINAIDPPPPPCDADFNGDGVVNGADLGVLIAWFGSGGYPGDLDDSGTIDGADLGLFLGQWGDCPK